MSYTAPIAHEYVLRIQENILNEVKRHCRIGKVTEKTGIKFVDRPYPVSPQPYIPGDIYNGFIPWWQRGPWCGPTAGGYVHTSKANDVPIVPAHGVLM